MKRWDLALAFSVLVLSGCEEDKYVIEMKLVGDTLDRRLTCWREDKEKSVQPDFPSETLNRISKLYAEQFPLPGGKTHTFAGRFEGHTPPDIGGHGAFKHFATSMGAAYGYLERFRGNADASAQLAKRRQAADQFTELLIGWFRTELGQNPRFEKLRKFCDEDLRQDLRNVGTYCWLGESLNGPGREQMIVRLIHWAIERGLLNLSDLSTLPETFQTFTYTMTQKDDTRVLTLARRWIADKMGITDPREAEAALPVFSSPERLTTSWRSYLEGTDAYRTLLRKWEEKKDHPSEAKPEPEQTATGLLKEVTGFRLDFGGGTSVAVRLACPTRPFATNGTWEESSRLIVWTLHPHEEDTLPESAYAFWSVPNEPFQKVHFGGVLLKDEGLAEYVLWRSALEEADAREWDGLVDGLKPGEDWKAKLKGFRFTRDPAEATSLANGAVRLLNPEIDIEPTETKGELHPPPPPAPEKVFEKETGFSWPGEAKNVHCDDTRVGFFDAEEVFHLIFEVGERQMKQWLDGKPPWDADAWKDGPLPSEVRGPSRVECEDPTAKELPDMLRSPQIRYTCRDRGDWESGNVLILDPTRLRVLYCRWGLPGR